MKIGSVPLLVTSCWVLLGGGASCRAIEPIEARPDLRSMDATSRARIELGRDLFFDERLSQDGSIACASCHLPAEAGADVDAVSYGVEEQAGRRNAPTVWNVGLKRHLFWDGRAASLDEQVWGPLFAPDEMGASREAVLALLRSDAGLGERFRQAFPLDDDPLRIERVADAIAIYEAQLITPTRVDAFLGGNDGALDEREQRGLDLFQGACVRCHDGPGVGGQRFEKLGDQEPWPASRASDLGRFEVTGEEDDRLVFAVPQLRNVARTAPYFHDGSVETLAEAVRLMAWHQVGERFEEGEIADVVAFLEALSADPAPELVEVATSAR